MASWACGPSLVFRRPAPVAPSFRPFVRSSRFTPVLICTHQHLSQLFFPGPVFFAPMSPLLARRTQCRGAAARSVRAHLKAVNPDFPSVSPFKCFMDALLTSPSAQLKCPPSPSLTLPLKGIPFFECVFVISRAESHRAPLCPGPR